MVWGRLLSRGIARAVRQAAKGESARQQVHHERNWMSRDCYAAAVEGKALTDNGRLCPMEHIVVENEGGCTPGDPHFDPEGAVCANDGNSNEAYCSCDVGPTACARCTKSIAVAPSDCKHFVVMNVTMPYSIQGGQAGPVPGRGGERFCHLSCQCGDRVNYREAPACRG
jgi:hypothetical protein